MKSLVASGIHRSREITDKTYKEMTKSKTKQLKQQNLKPLENISTK